MTGGTPSHPEPDSASPVIRGLFGFVGDAPRFSPLIAVLNGAATLGPLVWGIARGVLGRPVRSLERDINAALRQLGTSSCFIGYAHAATSRHLLRGGAEELQPIVEGFTAVALNGPIKNDAPIAGQLEYRTGTGSGTVLHFVAASHGDFGVRVLAAMELLPPGSHALLFMEPTAIVAARWSAGNDMHHVNDSIVSAERQQITDPHPLFYAQREEGTYLCSRRVLEDMCPVERVITFRLMEGIPGV